ncbi:MAG: adenylosuccinate lyase, partial [bacterium]|nr:adenylosuccinate lyase [bacterium]
VHLGMTSSDLLDTTLALQCREAGNLILNVLDELIEATKKQAVNYKDQIMLGRTHGVASEPITLGMKLALWYTELSRSRTRIERAVEGVSYGQVSGAVGTFAYVDPKIEELVCAELGLKPAPVSTQIIQRDRHAEFLTSLALLAASLEKFSTEIRHLHRTEVAEVEEPFGKKQKGSSAMPHKKNPIVCERLTGMARLVRTNALAGIENICLWHERDISHSSVERIILPDSTSIVYYMIRKFIHVVENMKVNPENMLGNLNRVEGLLFSQGLLLKLSKKGLTREKAYEVVQSAAMDAREKGGFKDLIKSKPEVKELLSDDEIEDCFDLKNFTKNIDHIFRKAGLM